MCIRDRVDAGRAGAGANAGAAAGVGAAEAAGLDSCGLAGGAGTWCCEDFEIFFKAAA